MTSRFVTTDPDDPDSPRVLAEFTGAKGTIRPGDMVTYENEAWRQPDGTYKTGGMDPPLRVDELIDYGLGPVQAIINDGEWEVSAANLRPAGPG